MEIINITIKDENEVPEYMVTIEDGEENDTYTLFSSDEKMWTDHFKGTLLGILVDDGDGIEIKNPLNVGKKSSINYDEAVYIQILLAINSLNFASKLCDGYEIKLGDLLGTNKRNETCAEERSVPMQESSFCVELTPLEMVSAKFLNTIKTVEGYLAEAKGDTCNYRSSSVARRFSDAKIALEQDLLKLSKSLTYSPS